MEEATGKGAAHRLPQRHIDILTMVLFQVIALFSLQMNRLMDIRSSSSLLQILPRLAKRLKMKRKGRNKRRSKRQMRRNRKSMRQRSKRSRRNMRPHLGVMIWFRKFASTDMDRFISWSRMTYGCSFSISFMASIASKVNER